MPDEMPRLPDGDLPPAMRMGVAEVILALEARAITAGQTCRLLCLERDRIQSLRDGIVQHVRAEAARMERRVA